MSDYFKTQAERDAALLIQNYTGWERNLRGWQIWDYAVTLEPPFSTIKIPTRQIIGPINDDARVQRGLRGLFGRNQNNPRITQNNQQQLSTDQREGITNKPLAFYRDEPLTELHILLPKDFESLPVVYEQFFLSLSNFPSSTSFEILADSENISLQMACDSTLSAHLKNQIKNFFPGSVVHEKHSVLSLFLTSQNQTVVADFGLARNFLSMLQTFRSFNPDPLTGLISSFSGLQRGEKAVFQVIFQKARGNWTEEVSKTFANPTLKPYLNNQPQTLREKFSSPLMAVIIRLAAESPNQAQSWEIIRRIGANFSQFSSPSGNELIALSNDGLSSNNHFLSVLNRTTYRSGMLLNAAELASLAHLPSISIRTEKLKRDQADTKSLPERALNHPFVLGVNHHQGIIRQATLSNNERIKHSHYIGASGSGKSTLLTQNMIQDLELGNGFACFDPHGDLIDAVLERVPDSRLKDVILFDPADEDYSIGFNILSAHSELEKTLLASDLVSIFRRFSTSWGDVMNSILANAVLAFLESTRGGSLLDLKCFLLERNFREEFLRTVQDEEIRYYWLREFPELRGKPFAPLLTRLDTFLRSKLIRHIVAQKENKLDFRRIMDERKILLVKLSLGGIGEENAYLLGSLLVAKLYHATLSRQNVTEENRPPFFLYLDEAHHFITESMNQILSGVRKYKLGLILAHQQLRQFQAGEADILTSVLANCYTRICFRLDDADAERLAKGFSFFTAEHLKNLGVGEAIARFEQSQYDFNLKTFPLEKVPAEIAEQRRNTIIEQTRKNYAKAKSEIESENQRTKQPQNVVNVVPSEMNDSNKNQNNESIRENIDLTPEIPASPTQTNHGRGGQHHRQIQAAIKRMAESYGFQVEVEKEVLEGSGSIDVSLEKENLKIACEVSVTTTDYEVNNVRKGLASGYNYVIVIASQKKKISLLESKVYSELSLEQREQVKVLSLPNFFAFLRESALPKDMPGKREKPQGQRMSFAEACEFLGIGSSTLYRWIREGRIPFYRIGRGYQFDREELVLIGRQDLSGKRKAKVKLEPLRIEKTAPKNQKEKDARYRKMLEMD